MVAISASAVDGHNTGWASLLRWLVEGDSCQAEIGRPAKRKQAEAEPEVTQQLMLASGSVQVCGDEGISTASWLLDELSHTGRGAVDTQESTCHSPARIVVRLQKAWRDFLEDCSEADMEDFVRSRRDQVLALTGNAAASQSHDLCTAAQEADCTLEVLADTGYKLLPADWLRISEAFQVDFVLHMLPGSSQCYCNQCQAPGHMHTGGCRLGPRAVPALHVAWRGHSAHPEDSQAPSSRWEPLGLGPVPQQPTVASCGVSEDCVAGPHSDSGRWPVTVDWFSLSDSADLCSCVEDGRPLTRQCCRGICGSQLAGADSLEVKSKLTRQVRGGQAAVSDDEGAIGGCCHQRQPAAGARFCVLLDGAFGLWSQVSQCGAHDEETIDHFRQVFIQAVASSGQVPAARVRVLEIGLPLQDNREVLLKRSGSSEDVSEAPDFGAGVLPFLHDEAQMKRLGRGAGSVRVLAFIKEGREEHDRPSLEVLDQVARDLANASSELQVALKPWAGGQPTRLWHHGASKAVRGRIRGRALRRPLDMSRSEVSH